MQLIYCSRDARRADALAQLLSQAHVRSRLEAAQPVRSAPAVAGPVGVWVADADVETARNVMRDHGYPPAGPTSAWHRAAGIALGTLAVVTALMFAMGGP